MAVANFSQGSIVSMMFNPRTRALSSFLSNLGAVIGAIIIGNVLDRVPGSRRTRSIVGWCFTVFFMCLVWGAGFGWQTKFSRHEKLAMDWTNSKARGPLVLMFAYYMVDSFYQGLAYYTMSTITNDPFRLARMAGYYKGVQSAGAAVSFGMDAVGTAYMTEVSLDIRLEPSKSTSNFSATSSHISPLLPLLDIF